MDFRLANSGKTLQQGFRRPACENRATGFHNHEKCSRLSVVRNGDFHSANFLKDAIVADLQDFPKLFAVNFLRQLRGSRMPGGRKNRRNKFRVQAGVVQHDQPARSQMSGAQIPIRPRDLIIVISVNVRNERSICARSGQVFCRFIR